MVGLRLSDQMERWKWASAACRGTSHERNGIRLQDAKSCFELHINGKTFFVALVADGAGSSQFGGQGASIACRTVVVSIRKHFLKNTDLPTEEDITNWIDLARDNIYTAAIRRSIQPKDFATTLLCTITTGFKTLIFQIGDGCTTIKDKEKNEWITLLWPAHGEYISSTSFLTDEPTPDLRISTYQHEIESVIMLTDGLERLALDFNSMKPFEKFFDGFFRPLHRQPSIGKNTELSSKLLSFLKSDRVIEKTDDDKTIIISVKTCITEK